MISDEILLLTEGQVQQHRGQVIVRGEEACAQDVAGKAFPVHLAERLGNPDENIFDPYTERTRQSFHTGVLFYAC